MSECVLFVQAQGDSRVVEVVVPEKVSESALLARLKEIGMLGAPDLLVFVDEAEDQVRGESDRPIEGVRDGARVHITSCRRIRVTVHYLEKTVERDFAPGTRVRNVKAWAVREFHLDHKDAAEHVLQICESAERPSGDTPLHTLLHGVCVLCFNLVPEKRVEGAF
jgi:hypothetical protein